MDYRKLFSEKQIKPEEKPVEVEVLEIDQPWTLILYNDDIHTFDEVIFQLVKASGCSEKRAEEIAFEVHNHGKATVYTGSFERCFEINSVLVEIQLITEIKG